MKPHVFHPAAGREYTEAAEYYARIRGELGGRFYDEVEGLILDIRHQPDRFRVFDSHLPYLCYECIVRPQQLRQLLLLVRSHSYQ